MSDKELNGKYVRKDVCHEIEKSQMKEMVTLNEKLLNTQKQIDSLNGKITATLVFSVATLMSILIAILMGRL